MAMACARVCVQRCLVVVQVWQVHMAGRLAVKCGSGRGLWQLQWLAISSSMHTCICIYRCIYMLAQQHAHLHMHL